ncbi:MAG: hypothetical protein HY423_16180 [Candidatus Lambdaproteobacteria bacterium]|nr:hypothetical protein [Candidatus Lambdaproteobacteria bacterium]
MSRLSDMGLFYRSLDELSQKLGGPRRLADVDGPATFPERGCYFYFEPGEQRTHSGGGPRVVRVGTHAVTAASRTTLWNRLSQHKGSTRTGGGNHRSSIFRLLIGEALLAQRGETSLASWGHGGSAPPSVHEREFETERVVSLRIGRMPFLWLAVNDAPGPESRRAFIERNAIGLLSNYGASREAVIDPPSADWLGRHSRRDRVRESGLWNQHHVDAGYDGGFLSLFRQLVTDMRVG